MSQGWISLHRQIWDNEYLWDDKPFTRGLAWIDLLLMMNHEDKKIIINKDTVLIKRGSRITSIRKLSLRWGWSRTKTTDFLNSLVSMQMAKIESDTKKTVVTIVNYDFFQDLEKEKSHRKATEKPPKSTNNNENNENKEENIKKKKFDPPTLLEISDYCKERKNNVDPKFFFEYFSESGWIDSKGNPVKNWKQKIITWEKHNSGTKEKQEDITHGFIR